MAQSITEAMTTPIGGPEPLTFDRLRQQNVARCEDVFHPLHSWTLGDWGVALAGETGEACNIIKKIKRLEDTPAWKADFAAAKELTFSQVMKDEKRVGEMLMEGKALRDALAKEFADIAIYLDLLAARAGVDLGEAIRAKFNEVSTKRGSQIKL